MHPERQRNKPQPILISILLLAANAAPAQLPAKQKPRARELGLSTDIGGTPGPLDAITDVAGVVVGHATIIEGDGLLVVGKGPVAITNTHSVGVVRDAILQWQVSRPGPQPWGLPVEAETYDGDLNDINGFHVKPEHVLRELDGAGIGRVEEGNVGGGTGMVCHDLPALTSWAKKVDRSASGGRDDSWPTTPRHVWDA